MGFKSNYPIHAIKKLRSILFELDDLKRKVIFFKYWENMNSYEISREVRLSRERVDRVLKIAHSELRAKML